MKLSKMLNLNDNDKLKEMMILQKLNKLFYLPQKLKEELEFLKIKRGSDSQERYGLHASAILASDNEFCYREQVLSLFYKQLQGRQFGIGLIKIWAEGDSIHEKWQRLFIRGGFGNPEDMDRSRFNKKYDLSFTPDAEITIGKTKYIVEIKSMNTFQFKKAESHPGGQKQLKFYMLLTGVHNGFVLVEDKNDQNNKVFITDYDKEEMRPYIKRLKKIQKYKKIFLEENKMPKRKCESYKDQRAQNCNMCDACFNKGIGRVKL